MGGLVQDGIVLYVSTSGDDRWSGRLESPSADRTDGPFATLLRARNAVREIRKITSDQKAVPLTVMIRGGKYYLDRTLQLTGADSGTPEAPVTYCAFPGETPVISGGRRVSGWKSYQGSIFCAEIPETRGVGLFFRDLYEDGVRQVRARYPKLDRDAVEWRGPWAVSRMDEMAEEASYCEPYLVWDEPAAFSRKWAKPTQGELFLLPKLFFWGDSCLIRIRSVDPSTGIIRLAHGVRDYNVNPMYLDVKRVNHSEYCQFIIENMLEDLTSPGEWCLDTEEGMLYYWPASGCPDDHEVVIPVLKRLFHLEGVRHVRISGLVLTETLGGEPDAHYSDVEGVGCHLHQPGWDYIGETVYLNRCDECVIEHNRIINVGGNGLYLRGHNEHHLIRNNEICQTGANAIVLAGGQYNIYSDKLLADVGATFGRPHPGFNEISNNEIHHTGLVDTFAAGIFLGLSNWNRVIHNDIHDIPRFAICLGNSRFGRNYVEYNRITRTCQVGNDSGAINMWGEIPPNLERVGHVIRYNYIYDIGNQQKEGLAQPDLTFGVYIDDWSNNNIVYGNIMVGVTFGVILKGYNNVIENNIFVDSGTSHIWISAHASYKDHATVVSRNIFWNRKAGAQPFFRLPNRSPLYRSLLVCDNNLYFMQDEENPVIAKTEPPQFQEDDETSCLPEEGVRFSDWPPAAWPSVKQYDQHSVLSAPLFAGASQGDFTLLPGSPALALGFQPIDMNQIGREIAHER
jgi:hypothetical protein